MANKEKGVAILPATPECCEIRPLPVKSQDQIDQAAAWIVRSRGVLVCSTVPQLSERSTTEANADRISCPATYTEIRVIEGIQEGRAQRQAAAFAEVDLLGDVGIELKEARAIDDQVVETAGSSRSLQAVARSGRSDVLPRWPARTKGSSVTAIGVRIRNADIKSFLRIEDDIRRQVENQISFLANFDLLLQVFDGHANKLDVAERER